MADRCQILITTPSRGRDYVTTSISIFVKCGKTLVPDFRKFGHIHAPRVELTLPPDSSGFCDQRQVCRRAQWAVPLSLIEISSWN